MDFRFSDDQLAMRDAARDAFARACPTPVLRAIFHGDDTALAGLWRTVNGLGLPVLRLPEADGGLGLALVDALLPLEEAGRIGVPGPLAETLAAAPLLAGTPFAAALAAGARVTLLRSEDARVGLDAGDEAGAGAGALAEDADVVVFLSGDSATIAERAALSARRQPSVDGARRVMAFGPLAPQTPGVLHVPAGGRHAALSATTATAAVLLGLAQAMLDLSVKHAQTREQFGQPIGAFQAVKHHLADAYVALAFARPLVYRAALSLDENAPDAAFHVAMAKAQASDAATQGARHALQVHGAIGYTTECALHFYLKRTWALAAAWGDAVRHRETMASHLLEETST